jgi:hypothetical protein
MLAQAAGLAFLVPLSPTALLIALWMLDPT